MRRLRRAAREAIKASGIWTGDLRGIMNVAPVTTAARRWDQVNATAEDIMRDIAGLLERHVP